MLLLIVFLLLVLIPYCYVLFVCLFVRASHAAKSEDLHGDRTHYELRRQYHCAAYKALMAVIMCTQDKMQFYHGFLFKEDSSKVRKREGRGGRGGRGCERKAFDFLFRVSSCGTIWWIWTECIALRWNLK